MVYNGNNVKIYIEIIKRRLELVRVRANLYTLTKNNIWKIIKEIIKGK